MSHTLYQRLGLLLPLSQRVHVSHRLIYITSPFRSPQNTLHCHRILAYTHPVPSHSIPFSVGIIITPTSSCFSPRSPPITYMRRTQYEYLCSAVHSSTLLNIFSGLPTRQGEIGE